jgi:hypothetical protein
VLANGVIATGIHTVECEARSLSSGVFFYTSRDTRVSLNPQAHRDEVSSADLINAGRRRQASPGVRQKEIDPPIRTDSIAKGVSEGKGQFICSRSA